MVFFDLSLYTKALTRLDFKKAQPRLVFTHCDTILDKMPYLDNDITKEVSFSDFVNVIKDKFEMPVIGSFSDDSSSFIKL